jgi:hypothetical protein
MWLSLVGALLVASACSGGGDDDAASGRSDSHKKDPERTTTTSAAPTSTTVAVEPPGDRPDLVEPYVQGLLDRYDQATNKIVADPSIAQSETDPVVEQFLELFDNGNSFARTSLDGWRKMDKQGVRLAPASPGHPIELTYVDGGVMPVDADHVRFFQCAVQRYVRYEADRATERHDQPLLLAGEGTAVRVGGHWRLTQLTTPPGMQGCRNGSEAPQ